MKKIKTDFKRGTVKIRTENPDDLWYLSQIIDAGDRVSGKTLRKIKIGGEEDRKQKQEKKPVFLKIRVEKVDFTESVLRVLGTIEDGPEDIARGEHHTFNVDEGSEITIEKERWLSFQRKKLEEAFTAKISNILIVVFDREEAYFALMKRQGYEVLSHIQGDVAKKGIEKTRVSNFYLEIVAQMKEYDSRYNLDHIIAASPAFWTDELMKNVDDGIKKKIIQATCSSVGKNAIDEVLKREEVKSVLASDRTAREARLVEMLMDEIGKDGKAAYGFKDVKNAVVSGAAEKLLITDGIIKKSREKDDFERLEEVMKTADSMKAEIHIINSSNEAGKKLDGLGGMGALLRYKIY